MRSEHSVGRLTCVSPPMAMTRRRSGPRTGGGAGRGPRGALRLRRGERGPQRARLDLLELREGGVLPRQLLERFVYAGERRQSCGTAADLARLPDAALLRRQAEVAVR